MEWGCAKSFFALSTRVVRRTINCVEFSDASNASLLEIFKKNSRIMFEQQPIYNWQPSFFPEIWFYQIVETKATAKDGEDNQLRDTNQSELDVQKIRSDHIKSFP